MQEFDLRANAEAKTLVQGDGRLVVGICMKKGAIAPADNAVSHVKHQSGSKATPAVGAVYAHGADFYVARKS